MFEKEKAIAAAREAMQMQEPHQGDCEPEKIKAYRPTVSTSLVIALVQAAQGIIITAAQVEAEPNRGIVVDAVEFLKSQWKSVMDSRSI